MSIGDFNEIVSEFEKEGGSSRPRRQIKNFLDSINWCDLKDLGFAGPRFTWLYQRADRAPDKREIGPCIGFIGLDGEVLGCKVVSYY